jgi:trigger factor
MKFNFEKTSNVTAELTVTIEKGDYEERVNKELKKIRRQAQMPGFRAGQVPMSIIVKRFADSVKQEEVQKVLGEELYKYIDNEKIDVLGHPMSSEKQADIDLAADDLTFVFDLALAPQFDAKVSAQDTLPYYTIEVTDEMVDNDVKNFASRAGHHETVDTYADGDMVKGHLAELDDEGNIKEGGLQKEDALILPGYMKNEDQRRKFEGLQNNTVITINPYEAYEGSAVEIATLLGIEKDAAAEVRSNFSYQVSEISRFVPAAIDQQLFDSILGEGAVSSEEEFRAAIREQDVKAFAEHSQARFIVDLRDYLMKRVGDLEWPDALLKRVMRANNPKLDDAAIEKDYAASIEALKWHLIMSQLAEQTGVKITEDDIIEEARRRTRMQFAQYGMPNAPEDLVERYANEMLKQKGQREGIEQYAEERKLADALQTVATLDRKTVSLADFNKLYEN